MTQEAADEWGSPEGKARQAAQAKALREQARAGGLRFEAYLPPALADWLLVHSERGTFRYPTFRYPSEAVFERLWKSLETPQPEPAVAEGALLTAETGEDGSAAQAGGTAHPGQGGQAGQHRRQP